MPPREAREDDPLLSGEEPEKESAGMMTPREAAAAAMASQAAMKRQMSEMSGAADKTVDALVDFVGGEKYLNNILDRRQAVALYPTTLMVARFCKASLVFFVFVCTIGLLTGFLFQGSLELLEEMNQVDELAAPKIALCAQPWGSKFAVQPVVQDAALVSIPSGNLTALKKGIPGVGHGNYSYVACPAAASQCNCIDFSRVVMKPKAKAKAGQYNEWEYLRVEFHAANKADHNTQYAFGFYAEDTIPQTWTYSTLGYMTEGDISAEEVAHGKTEFTDGEPCPRYGFRLTGSSPTAHGRSVLMVGYDVFLLYVIASVGSKWGIFSLVTLLITFCAAVNNFGLFEIMFPEQLDDDDPAQLMPNPVLAFICGYCCGCCREKLKPDGWEEEEKPLSPKGP